VNQILSIQKELSEFKEFEKITKHLILNEKRRKQLEKSKPLNCTHQRISFKKGIAYCLDCRQALSFPTLF